MPDDVDAQPLEWDALMPRVIVPSWSRLVLRCAPLLKDLTDEFKVFSALDQMDAGQLEFDSWRARCEALGIADVPLSAAILTAAAC
jgi:hypothetical protein